MLFLNFVVSALFIAGCNGFQLLGGHKLSSSLKMSELVTDPLLLRAARGEDVERVPVWMMRQAGRHMGVYRELCKTHKTFRERSEQADVATEISLQPYRRYGTDGCILFSDILTPFPAMGIEFDITEKEGPKMKTWTTMDDIDKIKLIDPYKYTPFVAEALKNLRQEVGNKATVLGFVGLPYTLATYMVEGGSSTEYKAIKSLGYQSPKILHALLQKLADNIGDYANYQIEAGAQVIQIFDSWAGNLSPYDYDTFAAPYQRIVVEKIKAVNPNTPIIIYINKSGALLERMANIGVDIISLDWTVTIEEARKRIGDKIGIQGNLDPMVLFAPDEVIKERTEMILKSCGGKNHVMNLGHGIDAKTSELKTEFFVNTVKNYRF
jgi:uroporphyrinogen decarboxylase